jgi:hypothetical protein
MSAPLSNLPQSAHKNLIELDRVTIIAAIDYVFGDNIEREAVILHVSSGSYYTLNDVGTRVWNLIQSPILGSAIRDTLLAEYDVEPEVCEKDLIALLNDLSERSLITMTTHATF